MAIYSNYDSEKLQKFLNVIEPWSLAYKEASFGFVGIKNGSVIELLQGQITLPNAPSSLVNKVIETKSFVGGVYKLSGAQQTYTEVLKLLSEGELDTPYGKVRLPTGSNNSISASFISFPSGFESHQIRDTRLSLIGAQGHELPSIEMALIELRSAESPYESISEVALDVSIIEYRKDLAVVHVLATNVVAVDLSREIHGKTVDLGVFLANGLNPNDCALGYRVIVQGNVIERKRIAGHEFNWSISDLHQYGTKQVQVPEGSVIQCFASYAGEFQCQGWIVDPSSFPNVLRVLHNNIDPNLENLKKYLFDEAYFKANSRDFETAVANLLFMLGFSVDPIKGKRNEDGPDLLATTTQGNVIIVECTVGQIEKEGKVGKLVHRSHLLKEQLKNSSHGHVQVIPVIITALSKMSVTGIESAMQAGVLVLTKEDLLVAIDRTIVNKGSDLLFNEAWNVLRENLNINSQEQLFN